MRARGDRGGATGPRGRPRRARRSLTAVSFQAAALSFGLHAHSKVKRMQSRMQSRMKQLYLRNIIRGSVATAAARNTSHFKTLLVHYKMYTPRLNGVRVYRRFLPAIWRYLILRFKN